MVGLELKWDWNSGSVVQGTFRSQTLLGGGVTVCTGNAALLIPSLGGSATPPRAPDPGPALGDGASLSVH